jgi:hypothetical protein
MKCVVLQPSYIPWRGYFHLIQKSDLFVFYDDVQFDKHGWRNRNRVKTPNGSTWLTIPVQARGAVSGHRPINEIPIVWSQAWAPKHLATIAQSYRRAPHFERYRPLVESFYDRRDELLVDFTVETTIALARELGIAHTRFLRSSTLGLSGNKTDRLIDLLVRVGATHYISGPSAREYIEPEKFEAARIGLEYISYAYEPYPQLHGEFDPHVSVLDLLFMVGPDAPRHIWGATPELAGAPAGAPAGAG